MGTVAMFTCSEVTSHGGGAWLPLCIAHDRAMLWPPDSDERTSTRYAGHVEGECERCVELHDQMQGDLNEDVWAVYHPGKSSEHVKLRAVSSFAEDDPNKEWAVATPSGTLEMTINNPDAWGFFEAGADYRLQITKRQPSKARTDDRD